MPSRSTLESSLTLRAFFFFNDTATTEIYPLSLHDALPISGCARPHRARVPTRRARPRVRSRPPPRARGRLRTRGDRKSTRLNSSHQIISYAVFCLKKKNIRHYASLQTPAHDPPTPNAAASV